MMAALDVAEGAERMQTGDDVELASSVLLEPSQRQHRIVVRLDKVASASAMQPKPREGGVNLDGELSILVGYVVANDVAECGRLVTQRRLDSTRSLAADDEANDDACRQLLQASG